MNKRVIYRSSSALLCVVAATSLFTAGCTGQTNKDALPQTTQAQVDKNRQENIDRVKNNPNISPETKAKALQYMGGGSATSAKPMGAK